MPKYNKSWAKYILKDYKENVYIFLPGSTIKSTNYDKYRDVGYQSTRQNYQVVKAWIRETSSNELIVKNLGLVASGAKKLVIKNNDINLFKLAHRIVIDETEFYVFSDAVGNKMQIQKLDDSYAEITIFKKDV